MNTQFATKNIPPTAEFGLCSDCGTPLIISYGVTNPEMVELFQFTCSKCKEITFEIHGNGCQCPDCKWTYKPTYPFDPMKPRGRFHHDKRPLSIAPPAWGTVEAPTAGLTVAETEQAVDVGSAEGANQPELIERLGTLDMPADPSRQTIHPAAAQHKLARLIRALRRLWANRGELATQAIVWPIVTVRRLWFNRPWRQLTPEEKQLQAEKDKRKKMASLLLSESNLYWDRIVAALDRYGYQHRPATGSKDAPFRPTQHVKFDLVKLQPEAIYFRVNTMSLPFGVKIVDLMDKDLLIDLSISCGRRVTAEYSDRIGAWLIVERAVGVRGIPDHVKYQDFQDGFPASADGLTIPIGTALNARPIYASLGRMYSMLIAGTIGGGKSNYLNVIITSLIRRNPPNRLKLILVDLKGGLEFQFYEGLPHLIPIPEIAPNGIADKNDQVPGVLEWLHREGERRQDLLRQAGYKSIGRYNAHQQRRRLPHIVLIIDEWADVMYDKGVKAKSEEILANVAQRFRAVGIHVLLCTQIPKAEVLTTRIKGVLPAKICFSVPTNPASMVVLDHGGAKGLNPPGRAIFQWEGEFEVQTPFINEEIIMRAVEQAISGKVDQTTKSHDVTQLELLEWALSNENGYLTRDVLHRQFGKRGLTKEELERWLVEFDNQDFVIGTSLYRVQPAAGSRPRRLIAIDEDADGVPDDPENLSNS